MMNMEDLYRLLRTSHVQAQGMVDTVSDPLLVLDGSLCVQTANRAFFETFGVDRYETIGQPLYELGNGQWDIPELRVLLKDVIPKVSAVINYEVEHDFPGLGRRSMLLTARPLHHPDTASHTMLISLVDVTDTRRRSAAKDMLFRESRHRMKNLLAVAQSLARNTATEGRSATQYRDDFMGRFSALVEAQDLAFDEQTATDLEALVLRILAPYMANPSSAVVEGVAVELSPRTVMSISLLLHELATNAAKYGALSVPEGRVRIDWLMEDGNRQVRLRWVESGGPPVSEPLKTGFGTQLIKSAIPYSLGGMVEQRFATDGLETEIVIPLGSTPLAT